jgi:uncharacterized protein (TIGR03083 family)
MAVLEPPDYLGHLRSESARFREVLSSCDPRAHVPGCPAWDAADLLWHLTTVQHAWADRVTRRPAGPDGYERPSRPASYDALLAAFDHASASLASALDGVDPSEKAWTWSTDQSVGFVLRRQAHEALIHRLDAEQAAGATTPLPGDLAADGVAEVLDVFYGAIPEWGQFSPMEHYVRIDLSDSGESVWVQLGLFYGTDPGDGSEHHGEDDIRVVADPGVEADAVVDGPAGALDAWLWRRGPDDEIHVHGDRKVYAHFRAAVHHPLS